MIETLMVVTFGSVLVLGFRLSSIQTSISALRAEITKGGPLTADEEEAVAVGHAPDKKA